MPTSKSRESQRFDGWRQRFDGQNFSAGMTGGYEGHVTLTTRGKNPLFSPSEKIKLPFLEQQTQTQTQSV